MKDKSLLEDNEGTCAVSFEEQRANALKHYEEAGRAVNCWMSFVYHAIKNYNPSPPPASILPEGDWQDSFWKAMNKEYPRAEYFPEIVCAFEYLRDNVIGKSAILIPDIESYQVFKNDKVNSILAVCLKTLNDEQLITLKEALIERTETNDIEEFLKYVKSARKELVSFINSFEWRTDLRTQIENILIAYDQMAERLLKSRLPNIEISTNDWRKELSGYLGYTSFEQLDTAERSIAEWMIKNALK